MANEFDICQNNVTAKIILIAINQKKRKSIFTTKYFFYMGG